MFKADRETWMYSIGGVCLLLLFLVSLYSYFELRPAEQVQETVAVRDVLKPAEFETLKKAVAEINVLQRANIDTWIYFITALFALSTLVIAGFAIVLPLMGRRQQDNFRKEMEEIKDEASALVDKIRGHEEVAQTAVENIRTAQDIAEGTGEEETSPQSTDKKQATASIVDLAIDDAHDLQRRGEMEAARAKWQSIANLTEGVDDAVAATAWFSVGYLWQGPLSTEANSLQKAMQAYNEAIRLAPNNSNAFNNRGIAKAKLGDHEGALEDYNEAIRLAPNNSNAFHGRGNAKTKLGDHEGALEDYDEAIRLDPNNSYAFNGRGNAKAALGKTDDALKDYDEAIRLNPNNSIALNGRGNSWSQNGIHLDAALGDLNKSIEVDPNSYNHHSRGALYARLGNKQATEEDFKAIKALLQADSQFAKGLLKGLEKDLVYEKEHLNNPEVIAFHEKCIEEVKKNL